MDSDYVMDALTLKYNTSVDFKGNTNYFVEGFITTTHIDTQNDEVSENCLNSMVTQLKSRSITLDVEHEGWMNDGGMTKGTNRTPVGDIVEAEIRDTPDGQKGIYVKARMNPNYPKFTQVWGSIKDTFFKGFSIAYSVIRPLRKIVEGKSVRVLDDLILRNVALTGSPVNPYSTLSVEQKSVLARKVNHLSNSEDKKMVETNKENIVENESVELKSVLAAAESINVGQEAMKAQINELNKASLAHTEALKEVTGKLTEVLKSQSDENTQVNTEMKSQFEALNKEIDALKKAPVFKGFAVPADINAASGIGVEQSQTDPSIVQTKSNPAPKGLVRMM